MIKRINSKTKVPNVSSTCAQVLQGRRGASKTVSLRICKLWPCVNGNKLIETKKSTSGNERGTLLLTEDQGVKFLTHQQEVSSLRAQLTYMHANKRAASLGGGGVDGMEECVTIA